MEGQPAPDLEPGRPLRSGVSAHHRHAYRQHFSARRFRVVPVRIAEDRNSRQLRAVLRPHRRCVRWPTPCFRRATPPTSATLQPDQHQSFAHAGGRAGVSEHPRQPDASAGRPVQLQHHGPAHARTPTREQGSFEIEQQLGAHSTLSVGYQHVRGLHLIISVNQNVPTCTAVRKQQRMPAESDLRQRQPVFLAGRFPL